MELMINSGSIRLEVNRESKAIRIIFERTADDTNELKEVMVYLDAMTAIVVANRIIETALEVLGCSESSSDVEVPKSEMQ